MSTIKDFTRTENGLSYILLADEEPKSLRSGFTTAASWGVIGLSTLSFAATTAAQGSLTQGMIALGGAVGAFGIGLIGISRVINAADHNQVLREQRAPSP